MRWASSRWVDLVWLLVIGVGSSVACLAASGKLGASFDELFYVKAGLTSWRTHSNQMLMRSGVMTLPPDVQTLPLYLWERSRGVPFDPDKELHTLLPVARAMNLTFWWLLLAYSMRLGRTFGGAWGGRLAVALVACDPNLLGHASLATTDIASIACLLVLVYHFWHGLGCGWKRRVLVPGLCFGLAVQAKASGMVFGLEAITVLGLWNLARSGDLAPPTGTSVFGKLAHMWHAGFRMRKDIATIALIGFTSVFVYTGSDWEPAPKFIKWAEALPDGNLRSVMVPVSHHLAIFNNAADGLAYQIQHNIRGHGTYLAGEWYDRPTWKYFPIAITMKVPEGVFALLAAVLLLARRQLLTPVAAVAFLFFALCPTCRVQIGIRFMFPAFVLGHVSLAVAVANSWRVPGARGVPRWFVAGVIASLAVASASAWPHGVSYFNQLWGGPAAGPRLLHDSNCDWGQGLPELRAWAEEHGEKSIAVWYYGLDSAIYTPPFHRVELSHLPHGGKPEGLHWACGSEKLVAISIGCLHGNPDLGVSHRIGTDWFRKQAPVGRTTFFVIYAVP